MVGRGRAGASRDAPIDQVGEYDRVMILAVRSGDAIAAALADRVLSGELAPGSRLPSERQLALDFGVSRPIVREALRSLVERGLIDIEPGRGAFVHGDTGPRRFPPLDLEYRRRGTTARQLSEARLMLEMEAAALATEHADEDDLSNMEMALKRLEGERDTTRAGPK